MIRALRPTDALAYLTFYHRLHGSAAVGPAASLDRGISSVPVLLGFLGRSLALEPGREAWVQIENGQILGVAAAKRREGADIWDVDHLAVLPTTDSGRIAVRILEHLIVAAADDGIMKVFLRLAENDPALSWARQVGFSRYCDELTYVRGPMTLLPRSPLPMVIRRRRPSDHHAIFQLYSSVVPFRVRQAEGMTLHEWRWTDGWAVHPSGLRSVLGVGRTDWVCEGPGRMAGWLRLDRSTRSMSTLVDQHYDLDEGALIRFGLSRLGTESAVRCISRDYQSGLGRMLEDDGFAFQQLEVLLVRGLAARVPELKLIPIRAS